MTTSLSAASKVNVLVGCLTVGVAGVFWTQRNYSSQYGGTFPDPVMIALGALGMLLVVLGLLGRQVGGGVDQDVERMPIRGLVLAIVLLTGWIVGLPYLGYVVGGIVFFTLISFLMRTETPGWKGILLDVAIAASVVLVFYFIFTDILYVRLPLFSL